MATITFLGAAQEVTGSCHLVESPATGRLILDCGMHQGGSVIDRLAEEQFAFAPDTLDAVLLSHAHMDHCGLLPKLVHEGFTGPILCTQATADLLSIMLFDALGLYERDLEKENLRRARRGKHPLEPEYHKRDVLNALAQCQPHPYRRAVPLSDQAQVTFHDAGHILGSAIIELRLQEDGQDKTLVYSGDLGKKDTVLMFDPARLQQADVVLMESTYGNRDHRSLDDTVNQFRSLLHDAWQAGGNVIIPAFAVGRTQELLFYLGLLHRQGGLDNWTVFLDSPMAIEVTRLYDRWLHTLDCEGIKHLQSGEMRLLKEFVPRLQLTVTPEESMAINTIKKGAIIIAGSGMCTGGRIRHHFKQRIWEKRNTIVFVGFQAKGTLGRLLVDGTRRLKLFGQDFVVKAAIETLGGFSAHAGQSELLAWASQFQGEPQMVLIHGEPDALDCLSERLWQTRQIRTRIPARGELLNF